NVEQEKPIGELSAYYVAKSPEPPGSTRLSYTLGETVESDGNSVEPIRKFIAGRFTADERATLVAVAGGSSSGTQQSAISNQQSAGSNPKSEIRHPKFAQSLPLVHILIPASGWRNLSDGLDGIAIDLPALHVKPT